MCYAPVSGMPLPLLIQIQIRRSFCFLLTKYIFSDKMFEGLREIGVNPIRVRRREQINGVYHFSAAGKATVIEEIREGRCTLCAVEKPYL